MGSDSVLVKAEEGFTTITMNRPERRNALSLGLLRDMTAAFRAAGDSDARGVILAANGPVFSAGHDFRDLAGADAESIRELLDTCTELVLTMQAIPQPVVARTCTAWRRPPAASSSRPWTWRWRPRTPASPRPAARVDGSATRRWLPWRAMSPRSGRWSSP